MTLDDTSQEQALPIGARLCEDQFTITAHLGAGGFGKTYRATDNVLGRTIVIKECFPEDFCVRERNKVAARSASYVAPVHSIVDMFMREARSLAKLRHPNIVGVHRAFEENDTAYMALDLIDGRDLLSILQSDDARLSPNRVKSILFQLLDAIEKVHEVDLLHRDISPDNIIIEKSGTPVLIDFGAARGDASRRTRAVSSLLVVKDGYSPQEFYVAGSEQAPNSDLYALAATFYHVLSGEAPPHSQTRMVEIAGQRPDPCSPLAGRIDGYEPEFLQAIDDAMKIHPADRLQSAAKWKSLIADIADTVTCGARFPSLASPQHISLDLERSLSRLVEETNDEVRKSRLVQPKPKPVVRAPVKPSKPDWIEEFNKESLEAEREAAERTAEEPETADPVPAPQDELGSEAAFVAVYGAGSTSERQARIRSKTRREIEACAAEAKKRITSTLSKQAANANGDKGRAGKPARTRLFGSLF